MRTFIGCDAGFDASGVVIFGAPFDGTASYHPGTRFAANAMRQESYSLEFYSPHLDRDLGDYAICDAGDLELPMGDPAPGLAMIEDFTAKALAADKTPLMIGGEHLVTLGAVRAAAAKFPGLRLVHFDAHTDLRDEFTGTRLSHATVLRRCWDLVGDDRIWQFGIRSGAREEFRWAATHTHLRQDDFGGLEAAVRGFGDAPVYFTVDLDVMDPAFFPGTGTPESGGVTYHALERALRVVVGGCNVVACDLVELSPPCDPSGASTSVALKLWRELVLMLQKPRLAPDWV